MLRYCGIPPIGGALYRMSDTTTERLASGNIGRQNPMVAVASGWWDEHRQSIRQLERRQGRCAATSFIRRVVQEGHTPRPTANSVRG